MELRSPLAGAWLTLTILALLALTVLVAIGWYFLVEQVSSSGAVAVVIAAALAGTAIALLRVIAGQRASRKQKAGKSFKWYYGWPALGCLFLISALGTVNAAFVLAEGASIVRQDINSVRSAYDQLSIEANRRLPVGSYETKKARLRTLLEQLWVEIYNPNRGNLCGVGDYANQIIDKIRVVVPDMPKIREAGLIRPCDEARAREIYSAYQASAYATLDKDDNYLQARGPERTAYLGRLAASYEGARSHLNAADTALTGFMGFAATSVQAPLADASKDYATDRRNYADLLKPEATDLPENIDITASQRLGSPAALMQILGKRLFTANAWFYIVFAFALDIGTTLLLTEVFVMRRRLEELNERVDPYRVLGANPGFLWVNPPSKIRIE